MEFLLALRLFNEITAAAAAAQTTAEPRPAVSPMVNRPVGRPHVEAASLFRLPLQESFTAHGPGSSAEVEAITGEQKLLYHLMRVYDPAVRPVRNASHPIEVKLGLTLINIFDMDEKNQVLVSNVWLDQEWTDELLRWDPADFDGIKSFRLPCSAIWLPDIVLYNNADDYTRGYFPSRAMVHSDGKIFWPPPTQLRSTCKIDVTYFPFDSQHCYLKFGSWTYNGFEVDVTNRSTNVDLANYIVSGEFDLVSVHQRRRSIHYPCCVEPYPDVVYFFHIRRKILYYMLNVVFPCTMMSLLTLLVFCLPPDSGEKIALGITVLLAFSVFVLTVAEKMPETSDAVPLIGIYLTVVMGMTGVSVISTVLVLNFHHRGPNKAEVPYWVRVVILHHLRRLLCMTRHSGLSETRAPARTDPSVRMAHRVSMKIKGDVIQQELVHDMGLDSPEGERSGGTGGVGGLGQRLGMSEEAAAQLLLHTPAQANGHYESLASTATRLGNGGLRSFPLSPADLLRHRRRSNRRSDSGLRGGGASILQDEVLKTLQLLISRQELDDQSEEVAAEWREVAQVIDRLLFWLFLVGTAVTTLTLLVIIPIIKSAETDGSFDISKYGLPNSD